RLVYRGQLDDSRPGSNKPVTGRDLRAAIDVVLAGKPVDSNQRASVGCSIKWKRGAGAARGPACSQNAHDKTVLVRCAQSKAAWAPPLEISKRAWRDHLDI